MHPRDTLSMEHRMGLANHPGNILPGTLYNEIRISSRATRNCEHDCREPSLTTNRESSPRCAYDNSAHSSSKVVERLRHVSKPKYHQSQSLDVLISSRMCSPRNPRKRTHWNQTEVSINSDGSRNGQWFLIRRARHVGRWTMLCGCC